MVNLMPTTRNFADVIRQKLAQNAELASSVEDESFNAHIATQIAEARRASGLSQEELADRVGTYQSVISRMEDVEYEGHSLTMLRRIGDALNLRTRVEFYAVPQPVPTTTVYSKTVEWKPASEWNATLAVGPPTT
ncbi:MAG: XRE family transcriptional regulator [Planctomycetota bacterium]|nr:MAG: XRE family transcriptional regulator [Planctomycetota bacterium]REK38932.1 MAG: XRE family transcriptional regulator [Planctomycetota bacterium]